MLTAHPNPRCARLCGADAAAQEAARKQKLAQLGGLDDEPAATAAAAAASDSAGAAEGKSDAKDETESKDQTAADGKEAEAEADGKSAGKGKGKGKGEEKATTVDDPVHICSRDELLEYFLQAAPEYTGTSPGLLLSPHGSFIDPRSQPRTSA